MVLDRKVNDFLGKLHLGKSFFEDAAELLVTMLDEDPQVFDRILEVAHEAWLTRDVLSVFECIGRKQLTVEAMFLPKHVLDRLIAFPEDVQRRIASEAVPVFRSEGKSRTYQGGTVGYKSAKDMTRREAARAIGPAGIRTPEEQAEILRQEEESIDTTTKRNVDQHQRASRIAQIAFSILLPGWDYDDENQTNRKAELISAIEKELTTK